MKIGILALQGGFELHARRIVELGAEAVLVKKETDLEDINGLIIPGGESTTLLKLCDKDFRDKISKLVKSGLPLLTTCAGTILIADKVINPAQESLKLIDIEVERNAYGRQVDSFITSKVEADKAFSEKVLTENDFEAVFIRAPKITKTGKDVKTLIKVNNEPVLVQQNNVMAATFHPELSQNDKSVHSYFLTTVK